MVPIFIIALLGAANAQWLPNCGGSTQSRPCAGTRRIINGAPASEGEFPYMVALIGSTMSDDMPAICAGSILNANYVLTGAHCTVDYIASQIDAIAGRTFNSNHPNQQRVSVAEIKQHSGYSGSTNENDISLLRLASPFVFSQYVMPVCEPSATDDDTGNPVCTMGWGWMNQAGDRPDALNYVMLHVDSQSACDADYQGNIAASMMCASDLGQDACQYDSGGPLVFYEPDSRAHQVGLVSWGLGCAQQEYPGVYTRINSYLGWIATNAV